MSRGFIDDKTNSLVAAFRYPGRIGFLGRMDLATGKLTHLTDLNGMMLYKVTSVAFDPDSRTAFYTDENYAYRELNAIDVDTGKKRRLLTDARIGDLAFDQADKSLWGIRHQNGFVTLVRIPAPYTSFNQIKTFRYGEIIFDLDVSPDGELIAASYGTVDGKQSVKVWKRADLEQGDADNPVATLSLPPSVPENFTFTPDGKALLGNSYYTGVSNVFRLDIASGKYDVLTNAATGFFRPQLRPDGSLFVYDYTGEGFNPSTIQPQVREDLGAVRLLGTEVVNARPELKQWGVGSPAKVPLDELVTAARHLRPDQADALRRAIIRSSRATTARPAFGYYLHVADPLQFRQLSASVAVSPFGDLHGSERLHAQRRISDAELEADLLAQSRRRLRSRRAGAAQPQGRRGHRQLQQAADLRSAAPARRVRVGVCLFRARPAARARRTSPARRTCDRRRSGCATPTPPRPQGGVDHEKGIAARIVAGADQAEGHLYPKLYGGVDIGTALPWANSSAWLYAHAGMVGGQRSSPLAAYYFGSFRNNYVDDRAGEALPRDGKLPGLRDRRDRRSTLRQADRRDQSCRRSASPRSALPAFYLSHMRPALFAGSDGDRGARRQTTSLL